MLTYASTVTASTVGLGNSLQLVFLLNRIRIGGTLTEGEERERERASILSYTLHLILSSPSLPPFPPPPQKKLNFHLSIGL